MKLLSPTESKRLNEVTGFVCLAIGLLVLFSLVSYRTYDPSWNTAAGHVRPQNLAGYVGAYLADLLLQTFGLSALLFPACAFLLGWKWIRSEAIDSPGVKLAGFILLGASSLRGPGRVARSACLWAARQRRGWNACRALARRRVEQAGRGAGHAHSHDRVGVPGLDVHSVEIARLVRWTTFRTEPFRATIQGLV